MGQIVGYLRVSTGRQGQSGLGLDAQREAIESFATSRGAEIVACYVEVETGKMRSIANRPQLQKALAHARRAKATLCVPKLDRLSRNVAFVSALLESNIGFVAVDFPEADALMLHILAAVAEHEAKAISARTRAALAQAKRRGTKLGASNPASRNLRDEDRRRGAKAAGMSHRLRAREVYADLKPHIEKMREAGASYAEIANRLNVDGLTTRTGAAFSAAQVYRILQRS